MAVEILATKEQLEAVLAVQPALTENKLFINSLSKEQLLLFISQNLTLNNLECYIEMQKNLLNEIVPDIFPDSHIPEFEAPGGGIIAKQTRTFYSYLFFYENATNIIFLVNYKMFGSQNAKGTCQSDAFYIFINYFCLQDYTNLYTKSEAFAKIEAEYQ